MTTTAAPRERPALTLAELEAYDPTAPPEHGRERRFYCPICGDGSDRRKWWRCLCVNLDTGAFLCQRPACGARGVLREKWNPLPPRY